MNVPVEVEIPEGWEPVAVRVPKDGDYAWTELGPIAWERSPILTTKSFFILRRKFIWPPWLTAEWIAMDGNGLWWAYEKEPSSGVDGWCSNGGNAIRLTHGFFDLQFPDLPWRESKMRNPHRSDPCSGA